MNATALTSQELIGSLENEARILLHLAGKIDRAQLDYRPSPKQRSTLELMQYLIIMGPELTRYILAGGFDAASWQKALAAAAAADFDQAVAAIKSHGAAYADALGQASDADLRGEIDMFGRKASRGSMIVNIVLSGCAAYRTQLFLYLKACGREELNTYNLWAGMDPPPAQA